MFNMLLDRNMGSLVCHTSTCQCCKQFYGADIDSKVSGSDLHIFHRSELQGDDQILSNSFLCSL